MKVLIFGGSGFLGSRFMKSFLKRGDDVYFTYMTNKCNFPGATSYLLDISNKVSVDSLIRKIKPDLTINSAAVPSMDLCETDKELAKKVNIEGTRNIVDGCKKINSKIIFISTSAVFDGSKEINLENHDPKPVNYHGLTHLEGEKIVKSSGLSHLILRTDHPYGWVEPWQKENTAVRIINKLEYDEPVGEVVDWYNTPTFIDNFIEVSLKLYDKQKGGIYHVVGPDFVNRYNFALKIAELMKKDRNLIKPIKSSDLKLPAKRGRTKLNNKKAEIDTKMVLIGIEDGIKQMLRQRNA